MKLNQQEVKLVIDFISYEFYKEICKEGSSPVASSVLEVIVGDHWDTLIGSLITLLQEIKEEGDLTKLEEASNLFSLVSLIVSK